MDSGASKTEAPVVGRTSAGGEPGVLRSLVGQAWERGGRQQRARGDSEHASGRQGRGAVPLPRDTVTARGQAARSQVYVWA